MKISDILVEKTPHLSFEVFPPKTDAAYEGVLKATEAIAELKPSYMSVTYGAGGGTSKNTVKIASHIKDKYNVPSLAHLTCVSSTKEEVHQVIDQLKAAGKDVIGVGKIYDIFEGQGVTETYPNQGNEKNMEKTIEIQKKEFDGLCYVNLVDGDMIYGHRRDIAGYAGALTRFDEQLGEFLANMRDDDMLMITADHGCDPGYTGTDHTREYVPCLIYGKEIKAGVNLHTRKGFADMAATIAEALGSKYRGDGESFWDEIRN